MNPFDGVTPSLSGLGGEANGRILLILGVIWGLCILGAAIFIIVNGARLSAARKAKNPQEAEGAKSAVVGSVIGLGVIVMAPIIVGAVVILGGL